MKELKYRKVTDWILEEIASGRLRPGERLMTEEQLSEQFGLSRQTVRRATQSLVDQNILTRIQGSGTYVGERAPKPRAKQHMNIAVVSTFYESYIFPPTLRGIEKTLAQAGYSMQVSFTNNDVADENKILQNLLRKDNIDGVIVEPSKGALPNTNIAYYRELQERRIPLIFFNDKYQEVSAPCVRLDDRAVAEDATRLLIEAGHRSLAGIFKLDDGQGHRRYHGFVDAVKNAGIEAESVRVFWLDTEAQMDLGGQESSLETYLFKRIAGCTGVVCYNDQVAMQLIEMALRRGIRVPEDLSVVGIDDSELAELSRVKFTSFPHPKEKLGEKVAENLLHMISDSQYDGNHIYSAKPVLRDSICRMHNEKGA